MTLYFYADEKNPGLQVTDFILWAINRAKKEKPDTRWYERLELELVSNFNQTGNKLFTGGDYRIGKELEHNYFRYPERCFPLKELPNSFSELVELYLFIEEQLLKIDYNAIPNHISHFQEKITKVANNLMLADQVNVNHKKIIQETASIYTRLFDTFPLYQGLSDNDVEQWSKFLLSRKFASYLLFKENAAMKGKGHLWINDNLKCFIMR